MQALFVDNLTVIDFAYFDPQRGIVGESLILDVELFGDLNDEGMLFDFSFVKKRIKSCVDSLVDHKFLVAKQNSAVEISETPQQLTIDLTTSDNEVISHISPHQAVYLLDADAVSPAEISAAINDEIKSILPDNVTSIRLALRPEDIDGNFYHYSHGLKKHFGDCQRIAHGHRSRIEVWQDNRFSEKWAAEIAEKWQDIYLATREDICDEQLIDGKKYWVFQYHANQGLFQLTIPQCHCYIIDTDTTVELIASYLATDLKKKVPESTFKIKAYEGVDKGSICII